MEHLFTVWPQIAARLFAASHVLLLSDYDGTLAPIMERPEMAELSPETRSLLDRLAQQRRYTIGIISGRSLRDLEHRVGLRDAIYAGNHGLEIEGPGFRFVHPVAREVKEVIHSLYRALRRGFSMVRGALVEHKGLTLSVHYRLVDPNEVTMVQDIFEQTLVSADHGGRVRTTVGKKVYEVRPSVDWHKGRAIQAILYQQGASLQDPLVVYMGDDLTDEDGFKVVNRLGGISVFVGYEPRGSCANHYLRSPDEVQDFIGRLLDMEKGLL